MGRGLEREPAGFWAGLDGIAVFVDFLVAAGAQQHQVVYIGGPVVLPRLDVVGFAGLWPDAAAYAASVSPV